MALAIRPALGFQPEDASGGRPEKAPASKTADTAQFKNILSVAVSQEAIVPEPDCAKLASLAGGRYHNINRIHSHMRVLFGSKDLHRTGMPKKKIWWVVGSGGKA